MISFNSRHKEDATVNSVHLSTCHKRLAHASYYVLQHIRSSDVPSLISSKINLRACEICHKEKQTRLHFPIRNNTTSVKFELVHMDL